MHVLTFLKPYNYYVLKCHVVPLKSSPLPIVDEREKGSIVIPLDTRIRVWFGPNTPDSDRETERESERVVSLCNKRLDRDPC